MTADMGLASLLLHSRYPGSPCTPVIDFIVPGLADAHFCAWGTAHGSVVITCAQAGQAAEGGPGAAAQGREPTPLHSTLVLDLRRAAPPSDPCSQGQLLGEPVLRVSYGGGPHLLLAACTEQWLVVCSLENFAITVFSQQTGSGSGSLASGTAAGGQQSSKDAGESDSKAASSAPASPVKAPQQAQQQQQQQAQGSQQPKLYRQLAAVRCSGAAITGVSWTQQLDGILVAQADGSLTMWRLQPSQQQRQEQPLSRPAPPPGKPPRQLPPAGLTGLSSASLASHGKDAASQQPAAGGDAIQADSAGDTAGAAPASMELAPVWRAAAPAPQDLLSAGASVAHPSASSAAARLDKGANIWWPPPRPQPASNAQQQQQQQQQQAGLGATHDVSSLPVARCERLKHPCALTGLEWSPGVLRKGPLAWASPMQPPSQGAGQASEPTAAWDDHPAIMTVGTDGVIRIWVEMLVLLHLPSSGPAGAAAAAASAPQVSNYFCMALVVEPPAVGPLTTQPAGALQQAFTSPAVAATWGRSPGCLLGRAPHSAVHAAPPVLWLLSTAQQQQHSGSAGGGEALSAGAAAKAGPSAAALQRCTLRVHAVRGLSPVVMSSTGGGAMSSSGGGSGGAVRPQAILWGQRTWEGMGAGPTPQEAALQGAALQSGAQQSRALQAHLSCWVTAEDEFPALHVFRSEPGHRAASQVRVQCCTLATVGEEGAPTSPTVHRHLAASASWHAEQAMHAQDIVSLCPCPSAPLLASLDVGGSMLLWHTPPGGELQAIPPPLPPLPPLHALAWAPGNQGGASGSGSGRSSASKAAGEGLLVAATATQQLLFLAVRQLPAGVECAQQQQSMLALPPAGSGQQQRWEVAVAGCCDLPGNGMPPVQGLHVLPLPVPSGEQGTVLCVAAIRKGPGGSGSTLHLQCFAVCRQQGGAASDSSSSMQIVPVVSQKQQQQQLFACCAHSFPAAVTASAVVAPGSAADGGSWRLAVGLASGELQVLQLAAADPAGAVAVEAVAQLQLRAAPAALVASPGGAHIAATMSGDQDILEVWRRQPLPSTPSSKSNGSASGSTSSSVSSWQRRYGLEARLALPDTPTALTWLPGLAAPAVAVGCAGRGVLLFAKARQGAVPGSSSSDSDGGWSALAELPAGAAPSGVSHLAPAGSALAAAGAGGELFTVALDWMIPPEGGPSCHLARWVLEKAGPLPQYHPAMLAALVLTGRAPAAAAVLRALLDWVRALREHRSAAQQQQQEEAQRAAEEQQKQQQQQQQQDEGGSPRHSTLPVFGSPPTIGQGPFQSAATAPAAAPAEPVYQDVPLSELVGGLEEVQRLAAAAAAWGSSQKRTWQASMASGPGSIAVPASARAGLAAADAAAPQTACGAAVETGQLDMGAFGMGGSRPQPQQARPAASSLATGQLDMGAFGMDSFGAQPQQPSQPAASSLATGQLDMGAFGMDGFGAPQPPQPAATSLATGQLDMGAFGMDSFGAQPPQQQPPQPAASSLATGQLDMGAFGMDSFGAPQPPQPAATSLATGQLDMGAFGMDSFGAQPPQQQPPQPAASSLATGQLDMGAFGMDSFGVQPPQPQPPQPAASSLATGQLDMGAFGMGDFGAPPLQPRPPQPAASSLATGQLDMGAFSMDSFGPPQPPQPQQPQPASSSVATGQLNMGAFGMGSFGAESPQLAKPSPFSVATGQLGVDALNAGQRPATAAAAATAAASTGPSQMSTPPNLATGGQQQQKQQKQTILLQPPQQQLVPMEGLQPLPASLAQQLLEELASWQGAEVAAAYDGAPVCILGRAVLPTVQVPVSVPGGADSSWGQSLLASEAAGSTTGRGGGSSGSAPSIPGLSAAEAAALMALVRAFAPAAAAPASGGAAPAAPAGAAGTGGPVDTCGARFLSSLSLALAWPGTVSGEGPGGEEGAQGAGAGSREASRWPSSASLATSASLAASASSSSALLLRRPASVKNAAGVEYTLPPASSAALLGGGGSGEGAASLAESWGLLPGLDPTAVLWAVLSGTQPSLLSHALQHMQRAQQEAEATKAQQQPAEASFLAIRPADPVHQTSWEMLRGLGAGFWLSEASQVHELAERLAKAQFAARRNTDDCALLYCALGKKSVLQGLYRTTQNRKLAEFLSRDFSEPAHRQAACKNAFVLLGQHRHTLAGAFFILGGVPEDAVGVCAHEMRDVQLALFVCRIIWGPGSPAERKVLERDVLPAVRRNLQTDGSSGGGGGSSSRAALRQRQPSAADLGSSAAATEGGSAAAQAASSAEAVCQWLLGDAAHAVLALMGAEAESASGGDTGVPAQRAAAMSAVEATQLLPLLCMLLLGAAQAPGQRLPPQRLQELLAVRCLAAANLLQGHGVHALALLPAVAACKAEQGAHHGSSNSSGGGSSKARQQGEAGSIAQEQLHLACALCLLQRQGHAQREERAQQHGGWRRDAQRHLSELQRSGLEVDADAVLSMLHPMAQRLAASRPAHQALPAFMLGHLPSLETQHSTLSRFSSALSAHSAGSSGKGHPLGTQAGAEAGAATKESAPSSEGPLANGHVLFRVDGDRCDALACSPSLSAEGMGRPLVLATRRHGLVEGEAHLLPPELAGGGEDSLSVSSAASDGSQRGWLFSRLINQMFEQPRWDRDYMDSVASEGEVSMAVTGAMLGVYSGSSSGTGPAGSFVYAHALCAHPTRSLFLSGCSSGRVHLWQFGGQRALTSYTPVPAADLGEARGSSLLSFSTRLRGSPATSRMANWGRCMGLRFSASGERFAAVGEGGVVSTWRLDAPQAGRACDSDGAACADWWHQGMSRAGRAVEYVGASSSVVVVGGKCSPGEGNIAVWDTLAPPSLAAVGRLGQHQACVTAICMLPGGWLLASGDEAGALALSDVRMMGGPGKGARVLWSVKAAHGSVCSVAWAASAGSRGSAAGLLPLAGVGGAGAGGIVTGSQDGAVRVWQPAGGQLLQSVESAGGPAAAVTGVVACAEGVVACGADGAVRLLPFLRQPR